MAATALVDLRHDEPEAETAAARDLSAAAVHPDDVVAHEWWTDDAPSSS